MASGGRETVSSGKNRWLPSKIVNRVNYPWTRKCWRKKSFHGFKKMAVTLSQPSFNSHKFPNHNRTEFLGQTDKELIVSVSPLADYTPFENRTDNRPKTRESLVDVSPQDYTLFENTDQIDNIPKNRESLIDSSQLEDYTLFEIGLDQTDNGPKTRESLVNVSPLEDYTLFENRIKSFTNWPNSNVSKDSLARAGFVYTGKDDIVICPVCKIEGYRWESGDNPMGDHQHWSPHCSFVRNTIVEHDHAQSTSRAVDTCGLYGVEILPNSLPEDDKTLIRLGIQKGNGPHNQDKITCESRLSTFHDWPRSIKQRPVDLAEAGFYYIGVGDQTLCFSCGGGLKDWEEDDDPWEQHALWFSKCVYLNLKKGKDFIEQVKRKAESQLSVPGPSGTQTKEEPSSAESLSDKCEKINISSERGNEINEKTLCKICYKNELGVVFLPCGHVVACVDCAAALKTCAVCRKPLEATVRAFLS